jgi:hypothetical protein
MRPGVCGDKLPLITFVVTETSLAMKAPWKKKGSEHSHHLVWSFSFKEFAKH